VTAKPVSNAGQVAVLRLYGEGNTYAEAGALLGITESAAKSRCARAAERLGTNHVTHTYAVALRRGLLDKENPDVHPPLA
jgi:DNA-binding CsgD family transcriptional regulator